MSYGDTGIVFQWTNPEVRHPLRWTIIPYLNNTADTGATLTLYNEDDMNREFGKLVAIARTTKIYDQILVYKNEDLVPSAGDTGVTGDVI